MTQEQQTVKTQLLNDKRIIAIFLASSLIEPENVVQNFEQWVSNHIGNCPTTNDELGILKEVYPMIQNEINAGIDNRIKP